ncbi:hypothetical protein ACFX2C_014875 [Malus domestica]
MLSKAHDTKAMAQAMSLQAQRELNVLQSRAQASHPCASHSEQPTLVAQPAPAKQPTLMGQLALVAQPAPNEQPILVAQPTPIEQPTLMAQLALVAQPAPAAQSAPVAFQAAQVGPRLSQPSRPTIKPGAFSPYFFTDLTFSNSNLEPGVYHPSTAQ